MGMKSAGDVLIGHDNETTRPRPAPVGEGTDVQTMERVISRARAIRPRREVED
jgi:hypothetical protein